MVFVTYKEKLSVSVLEEGIINMVHIRTIDLHLAMQKMTDAYTFLLYQIRLFKVFVYINLYLMI